MLGVIRYVKKKLVAIRLSPTALAILKKQKNQSLCVERLLLQLGNINKKPHVIKKLLSTKSFYCVLKDIYFQGDSLPHTDCKQCPNKQCTMAGLEACECWTLVKKTIEQKV